VKPVFGTLAPDIEVMQRKTADGTRTIFILINHGKQPREVPLPVPLRDVLANNRAVQSVTLGPQDVAVLEESHAH